eukprot:scaffold229586_cov72-Attheya_sp.AAC.1
MHQGATRYVKHIKICIKVQPDTSHGAPPMQTPIEVTYEGNVSRSVSYRCDVVHACEADGLKTAESNTLQEEIRMEFALGSHNLQHEDDHLLNTTLEAILSLSSSDKKAWLDTIRVARTIHIPP